MFDDSETRKSGQAKHSEKRALEALSLARATGEVEFGIMDTTRALELDSADIVYVARDVSEEDVVAHLPGIAKQRNTPLIRISKQDSIGEAVGLSVGVASAAIVDPGEAEDILNELLHNSKRQQKGSRDRRPKSGRIPSPRRSRFSKPDKYSNRQSNSDTKSSADERNPECGRDDCNRPEAQDGYCSWHAEIDGKDKSMFTDESGQLNVREAYLRKADLSGLELTNSKLIDADLSKANLSSSDFTDTAFVDSNIRNANLSGSNFQGANFTHAGMTDADLSGSNLTEAIFSETNLSGTNLTDSNLSHANLTKADLSDTDLSNSDLTNASLKEVNLSGADLRGADLTEAELFGADLSEVALGENDFTKTRFGNEEVTEIVRAALKSTHTPTRWEGADIASTLATHSPHRCAELTQLLITSLEEIEEPSVQATIIRTLVSISLETEASIMAADSIFADLLRDGDEHVRETVATDAAIVVIENSDRFPKTIATYEDALEDRSPEVRLSVAKTLAVISRDLPSLSDSSSLIPRLEEMKSHSDLPTDDIKKAIRIIRSENAGISAGGSL